MGLPSAPCLACEPIPIPLLVGASTEGSASQPVSTGRTVSASWAGSVMNAQLAQQPAAQGARLAAGPGRLLGWRAGGIAQRSAASTAYLLAPPTPRTCVLQEASHVAAVARRLAQLGGQGRKAMVTIHNNQRLPSPIPFRCRLVRCVAAAAATAAAASRCGCPQGTHKNGDAGQQRLLREVCDGGNVNDTEWLPRGSGSCHRSADTVCKAGRGLGWHHLNVRQAGLCVGLRAEEQGSERALEGIRLTNVRGALARTWQHTR